MSKLTKESCITILSNSVELAQKRGTYLLQEASLLTKAVDFFKKEDGEKPDFGGSKENPEIVAINLLLQGVTKAQNHRECPFNLHDAALLFDVYEFLVQNSGKDVAQNVGLGSSAPKKESKKSAVSALQAVQEQSDSEEDDNEIRPMTVSSRKGKERAH
jgi:hypothetical protein